MSWLKNIARCTKWIPIIWNDREWDYQHLLNIIEFKLRNMQHFFECGNTHVLSAQETSRQIKAAADALQRHREDNYCVEWYNLLQQYHSEIECQFKPYDDEHNEFTGFKFTRSNNQEKALRIWRKLNQRSDEMRQEDLEFVLKSISENIQSWWD